MKIPARNVASAITAKLKPGQQIRIAKATLMQVWHPVDWTAAEWVMESIVGAAYEYEMIDDPATGDVTFRRLAEPLKDGSRTYVSPDRRDGFERGKDGYWRPKK